MDDGLVLISYDDSDEGWATWLAWQLEEAGHSVYVSAWDALAGNNMFHELDRAMQRARTVLVVLSPRYLASSAGHPELSAYLSHHGRDEGRRLVGVRVEACEPTGLLGGIPSIDLSGKGEDVASEQLQALISSRRLKPAKAPSFPGTPPAFPAVHRTAHWVRRVRNPKFTGRDEILSVLEGSSGLQALVGMGGVGKTAIASELAMTLASRRDIVWWIDAADAAQIEQGLLALGDALGLASDPNELAEVRLERVKHWLEHDDDWVVILDGVPNPAAVLGHIPSLSSGTTVVTSRFQDWHEVASVHQVGPLSDEESLQFLQRAWAVRGVSMEDDVGPVIDALDGLPLALEQASAYMLETGCSVAEYLGRFDAAAEAVWLFGKPLYYHDTMLHTWRVSFEAARSASPSSVRLLDILSFLGSTGIDRRVLRDALRRGIRTFASDDNLDLAIAELRRYSLLSLAGRRITVHPVVQACCRIALSADARSKRIVDALGVADSLFRLGAPYSPMPTNVLDTYPHARAAASFALESEVMGLRAAKLLRKISVFLSRIGRGDDAVEAATQALEYLRAKHPNRRRDEHWVLATLAHAQHRAGHLTESATSYEQLVELARAVYGRMSKAHAIALGMLGTVAVEMGDVERGVHSHELAHEIFSKRNVEDVVKATAAASRAASIRRAGDPARAVRILRRVMRELEDNGHTLTMTYARTCGACARALFDSGHVRESRDGFSKVLALKELLVGPVDVDIAQTLCGLAAAEIGLGEFDVADVYLHRALDIHVQLGSDNSMRCVDVLDVFASLAFARDDIEDAAKHLGRALEIIGRSSRRDHSRRDAMTARYEVAQSLVGAGP